MFSNSKDNIKLLTAIRDKYLNIFAKKDEIINNSSHVLMSKNKGPSLYGMFYPNTSMNKYFHYKGTLVNDLDKCDFVYYFDNNDRLLLTIRKIENDNQDYIFYIYDVTRIDVVWFSKKREKITIVGTIEEKDKKLFRFLESFDNKKEVNSYKEYLFSEDMITQSTYAQNFFPNNCDYESETSYKYVDGA